MHNKSYKNKCRKYYQKNSKFKDNLRKYNQNSLNYTLTILN